MRTMFRHMEENLRAGKDLVLVTVVASSGATPRGAGARMLVGEEGRIYGTIGGGAVEYRACQMAARVLEDKISFEHEFTLTKDDVQNLGMICGGDVLVFFSFLSADDGQLPKLIREAGDCYSKGYALWLLSDLGQGGKMGLYSPEKGFCGLKEDWLLGRLGRQPARIAENGQDIFVEQINSAGKVYIFGGGHVSQALVPVLAQVGFRCVVLEDRPEFANPALFPAAEEVQLIDFHHMDSYITVGPEDYACVMTRGHAHDTVIQAQLLKTPACYIGVIGSSHKKAGVFQVLHEQGFTPEDTDRITSPIGLYIKAETPAEIAVSIAGQMILHRAQRQRA